MTLRQLLMAGALAGLALALPAGAFAASEAPASGKDVVLAGLYSDQLEAGDDLAGLGATAGKGMSLMGTFHHLKESEGGRPEATESLLEEAWSAQTTPMANAEVRMPAADVAAGLLDADIRQWGLRVKGWLDRGGGRSLLIAPMQEMNGDWVPYGMDPVGYQASFRRFVEIFHSLGLDETKVRWVFAPNGWSVPPYRIADYYPGDDVVDFIGVSAFNFGSSSTGWSGVPELIASALAELRTFSPYKPYLITQVGSSTSGGDRDAWLREMFSLAASDPNVVGLIYFNFLKESDWKVWDGANLAPGFRDGMQMPTTIQRWPLSGWFQPGPLSFAPYEGTFTDDDANPHQADIDWLVARGKVSGCADRQFCPAQLVTREQMATFVARTLMLPPAAVDHFTDDQDSLHEPDINALAAAGLTQGCGEGLYCPTALVSRQELADLLAAALQLPVLVSPQGFTDVVGSPHEASIGSLTALGIATGCAEDRFCPWDAVGRDEIAGILRRSIDYLRPPSPTGTRLPGQAHPRLRPI